MSTHKNPDTPIEASIGVSQRLLSAAEHSLPVLIVVVVISLIYTTFVAPGVPVNMSGQGFCIGPETPELSRQCWLSGRDKLYYSDNADDPQSYTGAMLRLDPGFFEIVPLAAERESYYAAVLGCQTARLSTAQELQIPNYMTRPGQEFVVCNPGAKQKLYYFINKTFAGKNRDYPLYGTRGSFIFDHRGESYIVREYYGAHTTAMLEKHASTADTTGSPFARELPQHILDLMDAPNPIRQPQEKK